MPRRPFSVLDLDEGEVEWIGFDHIVLDALPPRVRDMPLQSGPARNATRVHQQEVPIGERNDDIVGLMAAPPRLGDPHVRL
jgi:hypothetical protein